MADLTDNASSLNGTIWIDITRSMFYVQLCDLVFLLDMTHPVKRFPNFLELFVLLFLLGLLFFIGRERKHHPTFDAELGVNLVGLLAVGTLKRLQDVRHGPFLLDKAVLDKEVFRTFGPKEMEVLLRHAAGKAPPCMLPQDVFP